MNVKNIVLGAGIFIVFMLMLNYGIEAFYPSPQYGEFCKNNIGRTYPEVVKFSDSISKVCALNKTLQEISDKCFSEEGIPVYAYNESGCPNSVKECNFCQKDFNDSEKSYSRSVFIISIIIGIITLLAGFLIFSAEPASSALMASGVGAIFYGSTRNWANLSDIWRFLLLLFALFLLIWISVKINKKEKRNLWNIMKK